MRDPSRKCISKRGTYPYPKEKPKPEIDHDTAGPEFSSFFEKAKSLFILDNKRANAGTERAWKAYIANRVAAEKEFDGPRKQKKVKESENTDDDHEGDDSEDGDEEGDEEEEEDSWDEDEYDPRGGEPDYVFALHMIRRQMAALEKKMGVGEGVLTRSFRVLDCDDLHWKREEKPRTVNILTRIYSPTRPVYIDVRFFYEYQRYYYSTNWDYNLRFMIYNRPGTDDYKPSGRKGWRSIAEGCYGDCGRSGKRWVKAEEAEVLLGEGDVKDVYEALWGPLEDEKETDRRRKKVDAVGVLLAAVGIGYVVAVDEDEKDDAGKVFKLEGLKDRWFGRGIRKACGFQLARDPEEEKKGLAAREEERNRNDFPDEGESSEDDGCYYDEGDPSNSESESDSED